VHIKNKATNVSEEEEVYIVNLDSPTVAHMQFYWFISLLESGADTQSAKSETEEYFCQMKDYNVPILMEISMAKSHAVIACPFFIAVHQMFAQMTLPKKSFAFTMSKLKEMPPGRHCMFQGLKIFVTAVLLCPSRSESLIGSCSHGSHSVEQHKTSIMNDYDRCFLV
jgi:hypothetical protein